MKHHSQIRRVQRQAVQQFPSTRECNQDIDESQGIQSEGNPQPNNSHVEKRSGTNPPGGLIISALDSLSAAFEPVLTSGGADRLRVALGLFCGCHQMFRLQPPWSELFLQYAGDREKRRALLDVVECVLRKVPDLQQLFPMGEVSMSIAMANDAISKVLCDSGKLGQFFSAGGIEIDQRRHDGLLS